MAAAACHSLGPQWAGAWSILHTLARRSLVVTLFLIGSGLTRPVLERIGWRPLFHGIALWLSVSVVTLLALGQGLVG